MIEVVLARYKEDISWAKNLSGCKLTIYNKFEGQNLLPNVGYEAHTYLHHIVTNYDDLAEITVFSQANLHPHISVPFFQSQILKLDSLHFKPFTGLLFCLKDGSPRHIGLKIEQFWNCLFGTPCPDFFNFHPNGIFSVPAEIIRKHPLTLYQRALDMTKTKEDACIMERLWKNLFTTRQRCIKIL
jgi:hypothetical protein